MRISVGLRSGNSQLAVGLNGGDASLGVNFGSVRVVSAACHFPPGGNAPEAAGFLCPKGRYGG